MNQRSRATHSRLCRVKDFGSYSEQDFQEGQHFERIPHQLLCGGGLAVDVGGRFWWVERSAAWLDISVRIKLAVGYSSLELRRYKVVIGEHLKP